MEAQRIDDSGERFEDSSFSRQERLTAIEVPQAFEKIRDSFRQNLAIPEAKGFLADNSNLNHRKRVARDSIRVVDLVEKAVDKSAVLTADQIQVVESAIWETCWTNADHRIGQGRELSMAALHIADYIHGIPQNRVAR